MLVAPEDLSRVMKAASQEGFLPRVPDAEEFARRQRILLLCHQASGINLDISLGMLPFEIEAIERSTLQQVGPLSIRLPTPEDLVILKAVAHRPKDLMDIQGIIESHPDLDRERIRHIVREFAHALAMSELWDDIAPWLDEVK